jgi:dipeptidyl aminopeptidase/acylaminoacyl peptidase
MFRFRLVLLASAVSLPAFAAAQEPYLKPPAVVEKILDAPRLPSLLPSPDGRVALLAEPLPLPAIADMAQPMLRLAGLRINPNTNGPHSPLGYRSLVLRDLATGSERRVSPPAGARIQLPKWSPDGRYVAFTTTTQAGIDLWIATVATGEAKSLTARKLNAVTTDPCEWNANSKSLVCQFIPEGRGPAPKEPGVPIGPIVQRNEGKAAPAATYEDLLASPYDEDLFEYYATAQIARVDVATGARTNLGIPGIYIDVDPSPNGAALLVARAVRPFSYLVPLGSFTQEIEVWNPAGAKVFSLAKLPAGEGVPVDGVRMGPRQIQWRSGEPATLLYVEALDSGDNRRRVEFRDRVVQIAQPFNQSREITRLGFRYSRVAYGHDGLLLVTETDRSTRQTRTWLVSTSPGAEKRTILFDRSAEDRYGDPGTPMMTHDSIGDPILLQPPDRKSIYLSGPGASPQGDRPFLDRRNLETGKTERIWQSSTDQYEQLAAVLDPDAEKLVIRQESKLAPPNFVLRDGKTGTASKITDIKSPIPELATVRRELVKYRRADGVDLSGTLYYPTDYREGQKVPVIFWVYPSEFATASAASQVRGSDNSFVWPTGASELFLLTQGYAVLDNPSLPVVGGDTANNTYVDQTVAGAKAAVDYLTKRGIADGNFGVGGHSYGSFTTANLLAHSDLFKAGVARSGAFNRTLTPFGFQNERRTYWEARDVYLNMMPFNFADKINEPILLIHGMVDDNSGTFPIQSERMYMALKGMGATVEYVQLPDEAHGYLARETVGDVVARMIQWYDRYVKTRKVS